jgi:hypothetical protein
MVASLSNLCVTRGISLVDNFGDASGCFCYRIHASLAVVVWLMILETLRAVSVVESMGHLWEQFR